MLNIIHMTYNLLIYNVQFHQFNIVTELWNHHHNTIVEHFHHQNETPYSLAVTPYSSVIRQLLFYVFKNLPMLDSSYKWNHAIYSMLWLVYFSYYIFKMHSCSINHYFISSQCQIIFHGVDIIPAGGHLGDFFEY